MSCICLDDFGSKYCFARDDNEYKIYYYDVKYGVLKEYISEEKLLIIVMVMNIRFY